MRVRRLISYLMIITIILCATFSDNAQMIQNFDDDTLEYFRVSGSNVLVKNGRLYFDFPSKGSSTETSFIYVQGMTLEEYFCLDMTMNFSDISNFGGYILWLLIKLET